MINKCIYPVYGDFLKCFEFVCPTTIISQESDADSNAILDLPRASKTNKSFARGQLSRGPSSGGNSPPTSYEDSRPLLLKTRSPPAEDDNLLNRNKGFVFQQHGRPNNPRQPTLSDLSEKLARRHSQREARLSLTSSAKRLLPDDVALGLRKNWATKIFYSGVEKGFVLGQLDAPACAGPMNSGGWEL